MIGVAAAGCSERRPKPPPESAPADTNTPRQPVDSIATGEPYGAFAYVDTSGSLLLALSSPGDAARIRAALCAEGRAFPVTFDHRQAASPADNGRQIAANLANEAGDVFRAEGNATPNETCLLTADTLLRLAHPLTLERRGTPECDAHTRGQLRDARARAVVACWTLATSERSVMLVQYEPRGADALASVAVLVGSRFVFLDFAAKIDNAEGDTWRVGDAGKLSAEGFDFLLLMEGPGLLVLGIGWAAEEGQSLTLAIARTTGDFKRVIEDYRYWVPQ